MKSLVLVDVSNTFTKICHVIGDEMTGDVLRVPTIRLSDFMWSGAHPDFVVISSVVPSHNERWSAIFPSAVICWVTAESCLGFDVDYPRPETIGADRLANAAAVVADGKFPCIVIDFGTAVTFDVVDRQPAYIGGVIAPGLAAMTHYLHEQTALLPRIELKEPLQAIGKSTEEAMLTGAVMGYRGLVREILTALKSEVAGEGACRVVATGGDARLIAAKLPEIDLVDDRLTLRGLWEIAKRELAQRKMISRCGDGQT